MTEPRDSEDNTLFGAAAGLILGGPILVAVWLALLIGLWALGRFLLK
jgi:hypothetical protein